MIRESRAFAFMFALLGLAGRVEAQQFVREHLGPAAGGYFGSDAVALGDVDGDGVRDYAVSDTGRTANAGSVEVFSGASGSGLFTIQGTGTGSFASTIDDAGDFDGDGIDDLIVADPYFNDPAQPYVREGAVRTYSGVDGSLLHELFGGFDNCGLGNRLAGIDDLDGDGKRDLLSTKGFARGYAISASSGAELYDIGFDYVLALQRGVDRDGDGLQDLLIAGHVGTSTVVRACRSTDCAVLHEVDLGSYDLEGVSESEDVDGDGVADAFVLYCAGCSLGNGVSCIDLVSMATGTVLRSYRGSSGRGGGSSIYGAAVLPDFDADGVADEAINAASWGSGTSSQTVELVSGRLGHQLYSFPDGGYGRMTALGDLGQDGLQELSISDPEYVDPTSGVNRGRVEIRSGNDFWLQSRPNDLAASSTVTVTARGVTTGNPIAIAAVDVSGTPIFLILALGAADATEALVILDTVPPGLSGASLTFQAFAIGRSGRLVDSAREKLTFL